MSRRSEAASAAGEMTLPPEVQSLPVMLTVEEYAAFFRLDRKTVYQAIARGEVQAVQHGRTIRIPRFVVASKLLQGRVAPSAR